MKSSLVIPIFCLLLLPKYLGAQPQVGPVPACNNSTVAGRFSFVLSGFVPVMGGGITGLAEAGAIEVSAGGSFTGSATMSNGGIVQASALSGSFSVNSDCSGSLTVAGNPGGALNLQIVVTGAGNQIVFIESDGGTIVSGQASRQLAACGTGSLSGRYGYLIKGLALQAGTFGQFADLGLVSADGSGGMSGSSNLNFNGVLVARSLKGSYSVNADCTGSAALKDGQGNPVSFSLAIGGNNDEIFLVESDSATIVSGTSRPTGGNCATGTVVGAYSFANSGVSQFTTAGFTPFADSGLLVTNGQGGVSGSSTLSNGGNLNGRTLTGSYTENPDCTGSMKLADNFGDNTNFQTIAVNSGQQAFWIETDSGTTISGSATRTTSACNALLLDGTLGYTISGFIPGNAGFLVPFADSGRLFADGHGTISGFSTTTVNGTISHRTFSGTYAVTQNCSGIMNLIDTSHSAVDLSLVISQQGRRVDFIQIDSGAVVSGFALRQYGSPSEAVVNAASFVPHYFSPGSIVSIFGENLSTAVGGAVSLPLPTEINGTTVSIGSQNLPLFYVSPTQINAQVPYETQQNEGENNLVVTVNGSSTPAIPVLITGVAPAIFTYNGDNAVLINQDGSLNSPQAPAKPGDIAVLYMNSAGPVTDGSVLVTGAATPPGLSPIGLPRLVAIGGQAAQVMYLGLSPGSVGLFQANIVIPSVAPGVQPLVVSVNGYQSNAAFVSISN